MLKDRCTNYIKTLDIPVTRFCKKINISTTAFYRWMNNNLELSEATEKRINDYIGQYGF